MKLSVIVPVYNVEAYLDTCLASLVSQTEDFDEILLINDGSTDRSREICEVYACQYSHITLINQRNRGLAGARNTGLRKAAGDYVIFVDSDDYVSEETCAVIKKALRAREIQILYYNGEIQYDIPSPEKADAFCHIQELNGRCMQGLEYLERVFPGWYTASSCVAAYQRRFLEEFQIAFPEGRYFEDNFFSLQVLTNAKKVSGVRDSLYVRRCRENSIMTSSMTEKKCRDLAAGQELMWNYLAGNPVWTARENLLQRLLAFGIIHTFYDLSGFPEKELMSSLKNRLASLFFQKWAVLFQEGPRDREMGFAYALMLKEQGRRKELEELQEQLWRQIEEKLSCLPFQKEKTKVGIYGIGAHTETLLRFYEKQIGRIRAEVFFLVSAEGGEQKFRDKKVFCYKNMPRDTDCIVISSYLYQQEMYRNLKEQGIEEEKIQVLYTEKSICDLTMAAWILDRK